MAKKNLSFKTKLKTIQLENNSLLCVGLDSETSKIPAKFKQKKHPQFEFNKWIINQTHKNVCAYKINSAFYEAQGSQGFQELERTIKYLTSNYPQIVTIADFKRADIGNTNDGYVKGIFDHLGFDAVTLHPILGSEALAPFLERIDKGCIILCRTSNPGAGELQDQKINLGQKKIPLWQLIAQQVSQKWNKNDNCLLVVGATYPKELKKVRKIVEEMDLLIPGIGAQGGDLKAVLEVGLNSQKRGLIISSSRGIIFADSPEKEARKLQAEINGLR